VGPRCQREQNKKKRERERRAGAGRIRWAGRPFGPKGKEVRFLLLFFSFPFSNFFFKPFFFSNSNQTFSQEFYKLFRNHTSNQKPCMPTDDAQTLVVSKFIKLCLIF
jgi:hypothetical protein